MKLRMCSQESIENLKEIVSILETYNQENQEVKYEGNNASVIIVGNTVIKNYYSQRSFLQDLFYLLLFKGCEGICQIEDYDFDNDTIRMKYHGKTLDQLAEILPLNKKIEMADKIIEQVLIGLYYLHSLGITHGQINSSNIFCDYNEKTDEFKCYINGYTNKINSAYICDRSCPDRVLTPKYDIWCLGLVIRDWILYNKTPVRYNLRETADLYDLTGICKMTTLDYLENFLTVSDSERFGIRIKEKLFTDVYDLSKLLSQVTDKKFAFYWATNIFSNDAPLYFETPKIDSMRKFINLPKPDKIEAFSKVLSDLPFGIEKKVTQLMPYSANSPKEIKKTDANIIIRNLIKEISSLFNMHDKVYAATKLFDFLRDIDYKHVYEKNPGFILTIKRKFKEMSTNPLFEEHTKSYASCFF